MIHNFKYWTLNIKNLLYYVYTVIIKFNQLLLMRSLSFNGFYNQQLSQKFFDHSIK